MLRRKGSKRIVIDRASFTYEIIRLAYLRVGRGLKNVGNLDTALDFSELARDVT